MIPRDKIKPGILIQDGYTPDEIILVLSKPYTNVDCYGVLFDGRIIGEPENSQFDCDYLHWEILSS